MEGVLITAEIGTIRSLVDGSVSIALNTPELSQGKAGEIFGLRKKIAYVYISAKQIDGNEKKMVDSLEPEITGKTPSKRLYNVLYRCFEQASEGYPDFDSYYRAKMENIINTYKANLNP